MKMDMFFVFVLLCSNRIISIIFMSMSFEMENRQEKNN